MLLSAIVHSSALFSALIFQRVIKMSGFLMKFGAQFVEKSVQHRTSR